jgi:protease I
MADSTDLSGKKIALLATNGFEDSELTQPLEAVREAGADVTIISEETGEFTGKHDTRITADVAVADAHAKDFDGLLLPGGVANPDTMRMNDTAVGFVRAFFEQHKPVAAICHAPWLLIEAGVVSGRTVTSWPSLITDLKNAGATWVDEEVVVDQGLVTSRKPDDLDAFCAKAIEEFAEGVHKGQTA